MKKILRWPALVLAAAMPLALLVGCDRQAATGGTAGAAAMGRYVEQVWEVPGDYPYIFTVYKQPDGRIGMQLSDGERLEYYTTTDGSDWNREKPAWLDALSIQEDETSIHAVHFNSAGEGVVAYYGPDSDAGTDEWRYRVALIHPDNTVTHTPIGKDYEGWFYAENALIDDEGGIYLHSYGDVAKYDPATGEKLRELLPGASAITAVNGEVAELLYPQNAERHADLAIDVPTVLLVDGQTGDKSRSIPAEMMRRGGAVVLSSDEAGALYLTGAEGLYRLAPGGDTWEQVVDGDLCSLMLPSMAPYAVIPHGDNEYLVAYSGDTVKLINYVYSPTTPTLPDQELTVYTLAHHGILQQAAGTFRQAHPDVLVNIRNASLDMETGTGDDARRALNTELLAGKGPDVLLLDDLPMDSFIEKGVLADLTGVIAPLLDAGLLYENLMEPYRWDGALYAVPTRFTLPTLWGDAAAVAAAESLSALADYAEANPKMRLFNDMTPEVLAFQFAPGAYRSWFREDGQIDVDAVERYYNDINRLAETSGGILQMLEKSDSYDMSDGGGPSSVHLRENLWQEMLEPDYEGLIAVAYDAAVLASAHLNGFTSVMQPNGAVYARTGGVAFQEDGSVWSTTVPDSEVKTVFRLLPGTNADVYCPTSVVGINANSDKQELAAEFIRALLAEATQTPDLKEGFPVNRKAVEKNVQRLEDIYMSFSTDGSAGEEYALEMGWPSRAMLQAVADEFPALETPVDLDFAKTEMVLDGYRRTINGEAAPREAAEQVAQEIRQHLAQ